ncbi:MAG: Inner membrane transport protein YnfM [Syntrophorhabdaceae bacterium PtaU1.Bin034]|nr:MAG: Inner membrane transport protein YnfM [Syntrophorhabdaceae bacterium PtaU1.Bin034]
MVRNRAPMLAALFIAGMGTFLNLYATQPLLPIFRKSFEASELLVSLTVSATVLAVSLAAPLVGLLSDSMGRKRMIVVSMLGLAFSTGLTGTAANLYHVIVWRFVQGCFVPGIVAITIAYIAEETPVRLVGSTMATYITGSIIGGFCGRFVAGLTAIRWDWHMAFAFLGLITFGVALATWWFLPRSTRFVRQSNVAAAFASMRKHFRSNELLATYAVGFNVLFCLVGAFTYVNFYLADNPFLLGPAALGSIFAVYLTGVVTTPLAGHVMNRVGHRKTLLGAIAWSAIGMLLTLIHSVPVVITGLAMEATGVFVCQSASSSHVGEVARDAKSSAAGLYVSFYYLGGFLGSVLPGIFWSHAGWPGCVIIILIVQCFTMLIGKKFWRE